ncbi:MAG: DUF2818 family protein [Burkholderiaceae bacterium]|nr:MAG: DUF2818 family protein [Burkholderiaceae bacterium]
MSQNTAAVALLLLAFVMANLPFLTDRLFTVWRMARPKSSRCGWANCWCSYFLVGGFGLWLEQRSGQIVPQGWEFYAITAALFATFAFPGFVFRYLMRRG